MLLKDSLNASAAAVFSQDTVYPGQGRKVKLDHSRYSKIRKSSRSWILYCQSGLSDNGNKSGSSILKGLQTLASFGKFVGNALLFRTWEGDGREHKLLEHVEKHAERGNPESVIQAVDEFARSGTWFMNVGDVKGKILDEELSKKNPELVLELGTYCGYSAVRMASQLKNPNAKIVSLELMPHVAEIARKIIDHAGYSSKVEVLMAPLSDRLEDLKSVLTSRNKKSFDFVFLDHDKDSYLPDYLLLRDNGLLGEGTIIFADNMRIPGSPVFRSYLDSQPQELDTKFLKTEVEYLSWLPDDVTVSTFHKS